MCNGGTCAFFLVDDSLEAMREKIATADDKERRTYASFDSHAGPGLGVFGRTDPRDPRCEPSHEATYGLGARSVSTPPRESAALQAAAERLFAVTDADGDGEPEPWPWL